MRGVGTRKGYVRSANVKHPQKRGGYAKRLYERAQAARRTALAVKLSADEAIALYRAEKAKRATVPNDRVTEAKEAYTMLLANEKQGRRKSPNGKNRGKALTFAKKARSWELLEYER